MNVTIDVSNFITAVAALVAVLAWIETFRVRRIHERDFNFQRSADIRVDRVQYWADRDLPKKRNERDELSLVVKNVGNAFANEINFALDTRGLLTYAQPLIGLPPGNKYELKVVMEPNIDLSEESLLLRYRYDDYRRHWGVIVLKVRDGSNKHYGQYRRPEIISAQLDGSRNLAILESGVRLTPMQHPRWHDRFSLPYRRWRFRRDHPELFDDN